jgi:hypothetical protein
MAAQERKNAGKILKAEGMDALAVPIPTPLRGKGCGSHGPHAALGMTESCHECRRVVVAQGGCHCERRSRAAIHAFLSILNFEML